MKIVLFFGSFNPIHIGHLAIANYICEFTENDALWFVVTPHNPHKEKKSLLNDRTRFHLVQEAIDDYTKMRASDIEFYLDQPNFTIHTLMHLRQKFPQHTFSILMGSDNLSSFHKWKNYEQILEKHDILVYPRPGTDESIYEAFPTVKKVDAPMIEISSTFIRQAISNGKDIRFYLPEKVWKYIQENGLYR